MRSKKLVIFVALLMLVALALNLALGQALIAPAPSDIGAAPHELDAQEVTMASAVGPISGWFIHSHAHKGSVLLVHGVRSDRTQMIPRARWLKSLGYSVLLIDLPAHGKTPGKYISYGIDEARSVEASVAYLRKTLPGEPLGVIGVSLGGAAIALAHITPAPNAIVLESMFPTITDALANRLEARAGRVGHYLSPLLLWQLPVVLHIDPKELQPIDHMRELGAPVLIASGSKDPFTPISEAHAIYDAALQPKQFWEVSGAGHVDLFQFTTDPYKRQVGAFLEHYMPMPEPPMSAPTQAARTPGRSTS